MKISKACAIFENIDSPDFTDLEKKQQYKSTQGNLERMAIEKSLSNLYEQRIQCICTAKKLEEKARTIREKEG